MEKLTAVVEQLRVDVAANTALTEKIVSGFAGADMEGHRRYHEEIIQQLTDRRKLRQELISHLVKTSTWAALMGMGYALLLYAKAQLLKS